MLTDEQLEILKQINNSIAFDGDDRGEADKLVIDGYVQKDGDLYHLTPIGEKALLDDRARVDELNSEASHDKETKQCALRKPAVRLIALKWKRGPLQMEAYGGPAQPSPTIGQCVNGGLGWLEVECDRCKTRASLPLAHVRPPRNTPAWKLEAALKCRSCKKGRSAPPVHMIEVTETREIAPYRWVHPDEER